MAPPARSGRGFSITASSCLLALILLAPAAPDAKAAGQVMVRLACESDPNITYAVALPPNYDPNASWPLLLLMDPRGRALVPLELFRPAAARLGYIVISSYDTASDGAWEPNERAVSAMLPDARRRFSIDPRRLYLAGFSGTARAGWDFAWRLKGGVAGLIGFGAGLPSDRHPIGEPPPFFGGSGTEDFNYEEVRMLRDNLGGRGAPHRIVFFDGSHAWPPEGVASAALEWMELHALRRGLRGKDEPLLAALLASRMSRAAGLESKGSAYEARIEYLSITRDFEGLLPVDDAAHKAAALEKDKGARREEARIDKVARREQSYQRQLGSFLGSFHVTSPPPPLPAALRALEITRLQNEAASADDPLLAQAARRMLELVFVHVSFYEPRSCLERGAAAHAAAFLQIAETLRPDDPQTQLMTARARAQLGQKKEALEALARAAGIVALDPERLASDRWLAPIKDEPRFQEILTSLRR